MGNTTPALLSTRLTQRRTLWRIWFLLAWYHLPGIQSSLAEDKPDPYDLLYDEIMTRRAPDGQVIGRDYAAPLIFFNSRYLFHNEKYRSFIAALDNLSSLSQQQLEAYSNLDRALLQQHLWAVFDWSARHKRAFTAPESKELKSVRIEIQEKVASLMKRLALSKEQVHALPNTLQSAVASGTWRQTFNPVAVLEPYLPAHLYNDKGPWVCLSNTRLIKSANYLPANNHTESQEWRSTFLVFFRVPGDREDALRYLDQLNSMKQTPQFPSGSQFALVEQAMLINDDCEPMLSPLIRNIQLRAYLGPERNWARAHAEFVMEPRQLMMGKSALRALGERERHYTTFFAADPFEARRRPHVDPHLRIQNCSRCHGRRGVFSVNSRSRQFHGGHPVRLQEGTPKEIAEATAARKKRDYSWGVLDVLWRNGRTTPSLATGD